MWRELAEDLSTAGNEVTVLTGWPNHPSGVLYPGWKVRFRDVQRDPAGFCIMRCRHSIHSRERIAWRLWYYLTFSISSFLAGLTVRRVDVVINDSTPLFGVWTGWLLGKLKGARVLYSIMDVYPEAAAHAGLMRQGPAFRVLRFLDTRLCRWSDRILTLADVLKRQIVARGVEPSKIDVLPFWIDTEKVRPMPRDNAWRRQQGIAPEKFVALFAGTIGYASGAGILIQTAEELAERDDVLILVVGEGVLKAELQQLASHRELKNMKFMPFQPTEVLAEMQSVAEVGLVTLRADSGNSSVPSKVLGYMAAGRAVVASVPTDSDTARLIRDAKCGLVAPPDDPIRLAGAIQSLAESPERCRCFGQNARAFVMKHYSRVAVVARYMRAASAE